jgi:2-polyprenyl-6-methoxyphenol hydroxylase-like FAD-dependent oxidoreductase
MTILVAGGGIGGLTLALSLHQIGVDVKVCESAREVQPLGVGINLLPHAVRELTELGLGETLAEVAVKTAELAYFNRHGQPIWSEPRGLAAGYYWPQLSIHRGTLQMKLFEAARERLGGNAVLTGHHLASWHEATGRITASFVDAQSGSARGSLEADLLIAADGIHSTVRYAFYPDEGPPIWNGAVLWRGTTVAPSFLTGASMIMAGHEFQKFVCYPITEPDEYGNSLVNWIAERKFPVDDGWNREDWNRTANRDDFQPWFADWHFDWLNIPSLVQRAESVYEYPMVDRDPLPRWTNRRVTLLGDAAHPMYPIGSNGASQAILDARILTQKIQQHGVGETALAAYESERRPATEKIVLANRGNGPEQVMQLVEERATAGYEELTDVISTYELEDIAASYKEVAGFDKDMLNSRSPLVSP